MEQNQNVNSIFNKGNDADDASVKTEVFQKDILSIIGE